MAKPTIFSASEIAFLKSLVRHKVNFMIIGLAAAALQGAPVVTQDIDLWFDDLHDPKLKKSLDAVGAIYVPPFGPNPPMFAGKHANLFDIVLRADGLGSFTEEMRQTISVALPGTRVPVLSLERIIASKRAANRKKDRLTIPILEDALRTRKARQEK